MSIYNYEYKDVPLTSSVCRKLVLELFAGKTIARSEIVTAVADVHMQRGGQHANTPNLAGIVKKTLANLKKEELATNPSTGYWFISGEAEVEIVKISEESDLSPELKEKRVTLQALKVVGEGKSSVYLYYYPAYKQLAELSGSEHWECKVGMSERDPVLRIISQTGTALPEMPVLGLLIKTDEPRILETTLHGMLILKNRNLPDSPGTEWFLTNPKEIEDSLNFLQIA